MELKGSMVALVTPFKGDRLDEEKIKGLVEFHVENGTKAIIPCGTTGESATLSFEEHDRVVELVVKAAAKRIKVIAGSGSNNTKEAIRLTKHAKQVGADAALLISPYYNRPTQQGLYLHFKAIADAVDMPIVLYNIASRTGVNIEPETIAELAKIKNIVGVKESSGNLDQMSRIVQLCGEQFALISGDDSLTLPIMAIGGTGIISVVANIVPRDVADMVDSFMKGDLRHARKMHYKLLPLVKAIFIETNPIPVKTAMGMMGMIEPGLRLPMCSMKEDNAAKLRKALKDYGLIK